MPAEAASTQLETDLADLLDELSNVQQELLEVLAAKRECMARGEVVRMAELQPRAEALCERLQDCHARRQQLLAAAREQGLPGDSLERLATTLPTEPRLRLKQQVRHASSRMRLLQHQSLTNWVLAQRTILHLSQLLEIIATGGQLQPTYSRGESSDSRGALVDREV